MLITLSVDFRHDIEIEKQRFQEALIAYQTKTKGSRYNTNIDLNALHTWEEVLEAVDEASTQYAQIPGLWGKIRKGLRRFGKNNQAFIAWAEVLPSQSEYFSILCGGLKLIFGVSLHYLDWSHELF